MLSRLSALSFLPLALALGACSTGSDCAEDGGSGSLSDGGSEAGEGGSEAGDGGSEAGDGGSEAGDGGGEEEPSFEESLGIDMVELEAGVFTMGCTEAQLDMCEDDEQPEHEVWVTRDFAMSATEVTQAQYEALMGSNPARFSDCEDCPVENIDWNDAVAFANALSAAAGLEPCYELSGSSVSWPDGLDCEGYRLPTEAEWEFAARAGGDLRFAGSDTMSAVAWYSGTAGGSTQPVAGLAPNDWGLYDMSGNVWEWTWDRYDAYEDGPVIDPVGAASGEYRNGRDGAWDSGELGMRVSDRHRFEPETSDAWLGMRLARTLD